MTRHPPLLPHWFCDLLLALLILAPAAAIAHGKVPPVARTDSPGDGAANCSECHGGSITRSSPNLSVTNLPSVFVPGQKYSISVTLSAGTRFGFEATAEKVSNGAKVGTWEAGINNQIIIPSWVGHSDANTVTNSWTFAWTAPAAGTGDIRFYVAGLAANNNNSSSGDALHLRSWLINEVAGPPAIGELSPTFGSAQESVTLSGSNFGSSVGSVRFNGTLASVVSWSDQSILVKVPAGASSGPITITKGAETSNGKNFTVISSAPTPTSINPTQSAAHSSVKLQNVLGSNFSPSATVQLVRSGQSPISASSRTVASSSQISSPTFNLSSAVEGYWNVLITNPDGQMGTLNNALSIYRNPPSPPSQLSAE